MKSDVRPILDFGPRDQVSLGPPPVQEGKLRLAVATSLVSAVAYRAGIEEWKASRAPDQPADSNPIAVIMEFVWMDSLDPPELLKAVRETLLARPE